MLDRCGCVPGEAAVDGLLCSTAQCLSSCGALCERCDSDVAASAAELHPAVAVQLGVTSAADSAITALQIQR